MLGYFYPLSDTKIITPYNLCRRTDCNRIVGNILRYNRTCSYHTVPANFHIANDYRLCPYPRAFTYHDRRARLHADALVFYRYVRILKPVVMVSNEYERSNVDIRTNLHQIGA